MTTMKSTTDRTELETGFHKEMLNVYESLKETTGYRSTRFLSKVRRSGGLEAARHWLRKGSSLTLGFKQLTKLGRLDCAVEVLVLRKPWTRLFTDAERQVARERLKREGCDVEKILNADVNLLEIERILARDSDIKAAEKRFERLIPKSEDRKATLDFLADSIEQAHCLSSECWALTLGRDYIRLNVGSIEAFTIHLNTLNAILHHESPPPKLANVNMDPQARTLYRSVTGSMGCEFSSNRANQILPVIEGSHRYLIEKALARSSRTKWAYAHKPALVIHLAHYLRRDLPQPAYVENAAKWNQHRRTSKLPEEMPNGVSYKEGAVRRIWIDARERDPAVRNACLEAHGKSCAVCGMTFAEEYGDQAAEIIHVHHLNPLSQTSGERPVDPKTELRPVCPNCHAVIHQAEERMLSIDDVKKMRAESSRRKNVSA